MKNTKFSYVSNVDEALLDISISLTNITPRIWLKWLTWSLFLTISDSRSWEASTSQHGDWSRAECNPGISSLSQFLCSTFAWGWNCIPTQWQEDSPSWVIIFPFYLLFVLHCLLSITECWRGMLLQVRGLNVQYWLDFYFYFCFIHAGKKRNIGELVCKWYFDIYM